MTNIEEKKIKEYTEELEFIFSSINKFICKKCGGSCCGNYGKNDKANIGCWGNFCDLHLTSEEGTRQLNIIKEKYNWNKKDGFLDRIKGECKIPRLFRSITCQSYCCEQMGLSDEQVDKIYNITDKIKRIRIKNEVLV